MSLGMIEDGYFKVFITAEREILLRFSVSPILSSQRLNYTTGEELNEAFSGYKYLIYIKTSINEKCYFHVLYKQHSMTGPSDFSVSRVGMGFGHKL
ncbi:MAG: hypothetical protein K9K67_12925 [Bacteriovoracaceae bacterium]|nr:hypothetical protein [Bacteriovoracaceae bacterium]